jgi:ABC-type transport system substrate-binding protein
MTNPRPYLSNPIRAAELIKADLEKVGIPVKIVPNEWGSHLDRIRHGEHEMALLGWVGDNGDADSFLVRATRQRHRHRWVGVGYLLLEE